MTNAFLKRATEFIRDEEALISIVSPAPFKTYYAKYAKDDALLDLPVRVIGTPGSGKTTIGMATEFRVMETVLLDLNNDKNRDLADAYQSCGFIDGQARPRIAAVRLPMESAYRDFWELPYEPTVRNGLLWTIVQARAIQSLIRQLTADNVRDIDDIEFLYKEDAEAAIESIGGRSTRSIRDRAREIDKAIYNVTASLVPPAQSEFPALIQSPYRPFDIISGVRVRWGYEEKINLRPLVILDDAHTLHPDQFDLLFRDLARRETKIGRWVMMRLDRLDPEQVLGVRNTFELPEVKKNRDFIEIRIQSSGDRKDDRKIFRDLARDMANRYLKQVIPLRDRVVAFDDLLSEQPPTLPPAEMQKLEAALEKDRADFGIAHARHATIAELVERYAKTTTAEDITPDVKLMMRRVLSHRYVNRVPQRQFTFDENDDPDPRIPLRPNAGVADAARLFLHRDFDRPLHYGFDTLCDASQENAELFLQMAGALVARSEARIIRGLKPGLTPNQQQEELKTRATEIVDNWSFPFARNVRALVDKMASECIKATEKMNARLAGGPNTFGVPASEISDVLRGNSQIALVLKYAYAYDAINIVPDYGQGGKIWFLIELSGVVCLKHSLNLKRGLFLERRVHDIQTLAET